MRYLLLFFFLLLASGCATINVGVPHPDNIYNLLETGKGRHGTFLTLISPATGQPLPNTPYRLVVENIRMDPIHDITDAMGRTKFVRTKRHPKAYVIETVGNGAFGRSFHLTYDKKADAPARNRLYRIILEDGPVIEGISDRDGNTKYIMSDQCKNISVEVLDSDWKTGWYAEKVGGPLTRLCKNTAYFYRCFKTTFKECLQTMQHATKQCRTNLQGVPHAPFPTSDNTADEWPVQFASCVVSEYYDQMDKQRKLNEGSGCFDPSS